MSQPQCSAEALNRAVASAREFLRVVEELEALELNPTDKKYGWAKNIANGRVMRFGRALSGNLHQYDKLVYTGPFK
jgi:hypothetical protein